MSITYPPELLPSPDEGQGADVWVHCTCGCAWDPTMLASCPVCDPKEITDSKDAISRCEFCGNQYGDDRCGCDAAKDAEISKLKSQLEEARAALKPFAGAVEYLDRMGPSMRDEYAASMSCTGRFGIDDLRRAKAILNGSIKKSAVEEARAKAIEECVAITKTYGGDCDQMIAEFRALLNTEARSVLDAHKEGGKS